MRLRHIVLLPALLLVGCVTQEIPSEQVHPQLLEVHEQKLLTPYQAGTTVYCKSLTIEANPILFRNLTLPAAKPRKSEGTGFEDLNWSTSDKVTLRGHMDGAKPGPEVKRVRGPKRDKFKILIGSTVFVVDQSIRVRRLFRAPPTLTAHAKGHVMVIRHGNEVSNHREVRFTGGKVEAL